MSGTTRSGMASVDDVDRGGMASLDDVEQDGVELCGDARRVSLGPVLPSTSSLMQRFETAAGSVLGRRHAAAGRNNQDAWVVVRAPEALVAVVADGCSSGASSEVGARLGSRLLAEALLRAFAPRGTGPAARTPAIDAGLEMGTTRRDPCQQFLAGARADLLAHLEALLPALGCARSDAVVEMFLFTLLGVVVTSERTIVFAAGDGLVALDGRITRLTSRDNAPAYVGYALLGDGPCSGDGERAGEGERPPQPALDVVLDVPTGSWSSLLLGTDGCFDLERCAEARLPGRAEALGGLAQFWEDDRHFRNPFTLGRTLALANREVVRRGPGGLGRDPGLLPDDTTLVVLRRRGDAAGRDADRREADRREAEHRDGEHCEGDCADAERAEARRSEARRREARRSEAGRSEAGPVAAEPWAC